MNSDRVVIEISGLRIEREATIIERVDWRVERGENWAILGANGSGKTSLLRALTGYLPPTAGEIRVLGETYGRSDWRALRTRIGLVSSSVHQMIEDTETALKAVVSGRYAQIGYWGEMTARDRREAVAILARVEARSLSDRRWNYLSQGERQRVLIRRAPAMVLVTHHVEEVVPIFSHVLILKSGRVLSAGLRAKVLTSRILSEAFAARVHLTRKTGRYSLTVRPRTARVI